MGLRAAEELLFESESTLRLVDSVLNELEAIEAEVSRSEDEVRQLSAQVSRAHAGIADLPSILLRAYGEIQNVLESLKQSRDLLEQSAVEKIHHTTDKLKEVSSATEVAATDIMDGIDRALALVDQAEASDDAEARAAAHADLRNELFGVMGHMQFQDITSQQLNYASSVLGEMEARLMQLASLFDPRSFAVDAPLPAAAPEAPTGPATFDPAATTQDAGSRQALVDDIFGK